MPAPLQHAGDPVGIYVHLPFCRVRCTYCAFAVSTDLRLEDAYGEALGREIAGAPAGSVADTLFWGGGTPSRSSLRWIRSLDAALRERFRVAAGAEVTLEANPEDVTGEALEAWSALGVNRISLGVQSFHDRELIPLGRIHGRARALESLERVVRFGTRASLDLILGLPGQSSGSFAETLRIALGSGIGHLSVYILDLEKGSALESRVERGLIALPPDEQTAADYLRTVDAAEAAGLRQYEISNFARPGEESRHNLRYWDRRRYVGFGAGAHSFDGIERRGNLRDVRQYIEAVASGRGSVELSERLSETEATREKIFLALRKADGIGYADLLRWTGGKGDAWCERGVCEGWLRRNRDRVAFTPRGFLLSTELISELF